VQRIFVGDVQGCADELEEILERAQSRFGSSFELWCVGDLVNRGPENLRVLRRVRELAGWDRARLVLGNHELALLRCYLGLRKPRATDTFQDVLEDPEADRWIDWIRSWPLVEPGSLGPRRYVMVHAGVHPAWGRDALVERAEQAAQLLREGSLEDVRARLATSNQGTEPDRAWDLVGRLVSCRSVTPQGGWSPRYPQELPQGRAWHEAWSQAGHDYGVVYGHWALQGLHVAPGLRGLDTGYVHHGRGGKRWLTAWIPDTSRSDPFALPDDGFWKVPARRRYWQGS